MGDYEIRAVTKLNLDSVKDKAVIDEIEELVAHRKLGEYITHLLRFAAEHREDLEDLGFNGNVRSRRNAHRELESKLNDELLDLKVRVDTVFEMAFALKTAYEAGRVTGLETQVDNVLAAQIILQNQSNKLRRAFGEDVALAFKGMAGEMRKADIDKAAQTAAEMAVSHYGELLTELANQFNSLSQQMSAMPTGGYVVMAPQGANVQTYPVKEDWERNLEVANASLEEENGDNEQEDEGSDGSDVTLSNNKEIQFGGDLSMLSDFFGLQ